jgi:hypothetical protein
MLPRFDVSIKLRWRCPRRKADSASEAEVLTAVRRRVTAFSVIQS